MLLSETSFVTTEPAPIMTLFPIGIGNNVAFEPILTLLPFFLIGPC